MNAINQGEAEMVLLKIDKDAPDEGHKYTLVSPLRILSSLPS